MNNNPIEYKGYLFCNLRETTIDNQSGILYQVWTKYKVAGGQMKLRYEDTLFYYGITKDTVTAKQLYKYYLNVLEQQW